MERLSLHILSLLRLYDSVVLPGTGVFSVSYHAAYYSHELSTFFPPKLELTFREEDHSFDSLLLDSYIRKEQCSPDEAAVLLEEDMEELSEMLASYGESTLPGLGTLRYAGEELSLEPSFCLNPPYPLIKISNVASTHTETLSPSTQEINDRSVPALYGEALIPDLLENENAEMMPEESHVEIDSIVGNPVEEDEAEGEFLERDLPEETSTEVPVPEEEVNSFKHRFRNPDYYYIPIHKKLAKIAACLLLVMIVGLAALMPINPPQNPASTASMLPICVADTLNHDSCKADSTPQPEVAKSESADTTSSAPAVMEETVVGPKFYAIVAAFKTEKEAQKFISEHPREANHIEVIRNKSFFLISVSSASERADLEGRMPMVRTSFPDAWIYSES